MYILSEKLKHLKHKLKVWNKDVFGNVHDRVSKAQQAVDRIQEQTSVLGFSDDRFEQEKAAQMELSLALSFQEEFWREKSRIDWHSNGDRNTSFFHKVTKFRNTTKKMSVLKKDGLILDRKEDIESHVCEFYTSLFASENNCSDNGLIEQVISPAVSLEDNIMLTNPPSLEEVKNAVFSMNVNGAPGPDGFGAFFYQRFWDVVGHDVFAAVLQFFQQGWILPNFNSNVVVLIPKTPEAVSIDQYRPISLANFKFKIITKVLADRLVVVAPKIISENQRGFIKGRHIHDCIGVASEAVNLMHKRSFGGNIALTIDIKKAFDSLDWNFLLKVLHQFGFDPIFCNWVKTVLLSAKLSISVNGNLVGFFSCKRGVRQGDPLSPLLFCVAEEVLSRAISLLVQQGKLLPMSSPRGYQVPSHVLYADDILIFCRGTKRNIDCLMSLFTRYGEASGQLISLDKSIVYHGNVPSRRLTEIINTLGFKLGHLPFIYLGVPLFRGKPKKIHRMYIADKIKIKLANWKGAMLSVMGRVQLVKSTIQGMLLYSFQIYVWPVSLLKLLDTWIRNFIWSGSIDSRKIVTVAWNTLCSPFAEGGLGLRSLSSINKAALLKR